MHLSLPLFIRDSPALALVISANGVDFVNDVGVKTPILLRFFGESPALALLISAKGHDLLNDVGVEPPILLSIS